MAQSDRRSAFEARLSALRYKLESGLIDRAQALRNLATRLEAGDEQARREIKTESHKLRGVAGTYGHEDLTELAGEVERRASLSPCEVVGKMTRELADLAEHKGSRSIPPPPAPPDSDAQPKTPTLSSRPPKLDIALRVLAVDDDPITQRLLSLTLTQVGGFEASIVGSSAEGLALLAVQPFDVVLSDAMMPDMNGRDFLREARARGAEVPVIILSAASPEELGWSESLDAEIAWLRKPFKPTHLVKDIVRVVRTFRGSQAR